MGVSDAAEHHASADLRKKTGGRTGICRSSSSADCKTVRTARLQRSAY